MKALKIALVAAFALSTNAMAGVYTTDIDAASATGTASVTILTPITITETQAMDFGVVLSGANDVKAEGTFDLTGTATYGYEFDVPAVATCEAPAEGSISVALSDSTSGSFDDQGASSEVVKGALAVDAGTTAGAYSCQYTVAAQYQ